MAVVCLAGGVWWGVRLIWPVVPVVVNAPLPQAVYLWQRQWTGPVRSAVEAAGTDGAFSELLIFGAEIVVSGPGGREVGVTLADGVDWRLLARGGRAVGIVVRVRGVRGEVSTRKEPFDTLWRTFEGLLAHARAAGVRVAELQVDFDCPTARLGGFVEVMGGLRRGWPRERLTFTALPAWLRSPAFPALARKADGYVLQVHSFEMSGPGHRPPATLCDPESARQAVRRAARLGFPFRVALPTYSYRLVLGADDGLIAAAAEGAPLEAARPPAGGSARLLEADPAGLAGLIAGWTARRPAALTGVVWYRLPVPGSDRLNWPSTTLAAVMAGRVPRARVICEFPPGSAAPGGGGAALREVRLHNAGDAPAAFPVSVRVRCPVEPAAVEGIGAYEVAVSRAAGGGGWEIVLRGRGDHADRRLGPGATAACGWVRLPEGSDADSLTGEPEVSLPSNVDR